MRAARAFLERAEHSSELSLADVANLAGMARSNVYRYFDTREAILLAILAAELSGWIDDVVRQLEAPTGDVEARVEHLALVIDEATGPRPLLCHLVSVVPSLLDTAQTSLPALGSELEEGRERLITAMHQALPELDEEQHLGLVRHVVSFVIGAWPLSSSAPDSGHTLCDRRKPGFQRELRRAVRVVARGILAPPEAGPDPG